MTDSFEEIFVELKQSAAIALITDIYLATSISERHTATRDFLDFANHINANGGVNGVGSKIVSSARGSITPKNDTKKTCFIAALKMKLMGRFA